MTKRPTWSIDDLLRATGGRLLYGNPEAGFDNVAIDSRQLEPQDLFLAVKGEVHDGHRFCADVVAGGCRGLIVDPQTKIQLDHQNWEGAGVSCIEVEDTTRALGRLARYHRRRCRPRRDLQRP